MKKEIKNIEGSVRAKLDNKRKELNIPFLQILRTYAMERFLYRLSKAIFADDFVLKGALLFTAWKVSERRTTLDIDLLAHYSNQISAIEKVVKDVCAVDVTLDGLRFDPTSVIGTKIKEDADYEGVRVKFVSFLGKSQIPMQIDFGFGDTVYPSPKMLTYPVILDFPAPRIKGYAPETVVSEKFEAMVQLGALNSRMKDFYDVWLLMRQFYFKGPNLTEALKRTFEHRKIELPQGQRLLVDEIYDEKSDRQTLWKAFLKKSGIEHAPEKLVVVAKEIEGFLRGPVEAVKAGIVFHDQWQAPGPWKAGVKN
ncbi:MAG: nucleotidyl transferase AbiEii/AbiGii toxin family protein [Candidatus Omnitrophica bacterium]|nr:nucleotidyl transferase AbiEii/AbiGii toxin family protein [Candidatus Omnitrophota bacterium]